MANRKVIISCAVTGGIHAPTMSPHLPVALAEIAEQDIVDVEAMRRSCICTRVTLKTAARRHPQISTCSFRR